MATAAPIHTSAHAPKATSAAKATADITVIDWYAPWCQPCRAMEPILDQLKTEYAGKVTFTAINVDEHPDLANANGVMSMPTFHIKKGNVIVQTLIGYQSKQEMEKVLKPLLNPVVN